MVFKLGSERRDVIETNDFIINRGRGPLPLEPHHTSYGPALSNSEIARIELQADEKLVVTRLQVELEGGGTDSNFNVDIYDDSEGTLIAETSSLNVAGSDPIGESSAGATVLVRVTNATGSAQDATITGMTFIREA